MLQPDLQARLLADLQPFAVPRDARWDPLGLMAVVQALRELLAQASNPRAILALIYGKGYSFK